MSAGTQLWWQQLGRQRLSRVPSRQSKRPVHIKQQGAAPRDGSSLNQTAERRAMQQQENSLIRLVSQCCLGTQLAGCSSVKEGMESKRANDSLLALGCLGLAGVCLLHSVPPIVAAYGRPSTARAPPSKDHVQPCPAGLFGGSPGHLASCGCRVRACKRRDEGHWGLKTLEGRLQCCVQVAHPAVLSNPSSHCPSRSGTAQQARPPPHHRRPSARRRAVQRWLPA